MGDDFANLQVFVGGADAESLRRRVVEAVRGHLSECGLVEVSEPVDGGRSVAVGPAGRWVAVLDSAGGGDSPDPGAFQRLSLALSVVAPVVAVHMDDSAAVHFHLARGGSPVDRFGNAKGVGLGWESPEEAAAYRGRPELWADLMIEPSALPDLRAAWSDTWDGMSILDKTARLLGWDAALCEIGFTVDDDGVPCPYREHLDGQDEFLRGFEDLHFGPAPGDPGGPAV